MLSDQLYPAGVHLWQKAVNFFFLILKAYLLEKKRRIEKKFLFSAFIYADRRGNRTVKLAACLMSRKNSRKTSGTRIHNTEVIYVYVVYASFIILNALVQNGARHVCK